MNHRKIPLTLLSMIAAIWFGQTATSQAQPPPGLVSWWKAENNTLDSQGVNNGTPQGTVNYAPGAVGQGFLFANDGYVDIASPALNTYNTAFSIAGWFVSDSGAQPPLLNLRTIANNSGWTLEESGPTNINFAIAKTAGGGGFTLLSSTGWVANTPYYVAATFDGSTMNIYRNGSLVATRTDAADTVLEPSSPKMQIGRNIVNGTLWSGQIDEVQFYDRALTAAEVASLAQTRVIPITNGTFDADNNTANGGQNLSVNQYTTSFGTGVAVFDALTNAFLGTADVPGFVTGEGVQFLDPATFYGTGGGAPLTQPTGSLGTGNPSISSSATNVLSNTNVAANSTYTMTLQLFERSDLPLSTVFAMQLLAGGVDLGGTLTVVMPTLTQPGSATLVVTTGSAVNNGPLSFQATATGVGQINFDNLALEVSSVSSLQLTGAVSRKTHSTAGDFDLPLVLDPATSSTVEPRLGGPTTVIFTFSDNIVAADGMISSNEFTITNATFGSASISGNELTLNLSNVIDQSVVSVTLNGIDDTNHNPLTGDNDVAIRALVGDANQDQIVDGNDFTAVKAHAGQPLDQMSGNFLFDLNINGVIARPDGQVVRVNKDHSVP